MFNVKKFKLFLQVKFHLLFEKKQGSSELDCRAILARRLRERPVVAGYRCSSVFHSSMKFAMRTQDSDCTIKLVELLRKMHQACKIRSRDLRKMLRRTTEAHEVQFNCLMSEI